MPLSTLLRAASVAIPVIFAGGAAMSQQIVTMPPGVVIVLVPGGTTAGTPIGGMPSGAVPIEMRAPATTELLPVARVADPSLIQRVFAEQNAMMGRMMTDINAMFGQGPASSGPLTSVRAMMARAGGMPATGAPPTGAMVCEESISVAYAGNRAPVVHVSHAGNGCGPSTGASPLPAEALPPPTLSGPRVREIEAAAPIATPGVHHRT